ncbi:unnamed protein product [Brassicogethes aeneus]|uniref:Cytoplasmic dynein 2 heavy chain 1 n=1 Tax=Brassicogethes aeneus TaxID=1431903 RepID=A0A9P0B327_BRAAE|nr:unnamed protein product [Brassicogethes aeneus]
MSFTLKKSVIFISGCNLGINLLENDFGKDVIGLNDLETFLSEQKCLILYAVLEESEKSKKIKFFRNADKNNYSRLVILSKEKPCVITEENLFSCIQVSSISGPPTLALYYSINNIFTPLLKEEHRQILQKHIYNMKTDLRSFILTNDTDCMEDMSQSLMVVNSLEHEVEYWGSGKCSSKKDQLSKATSASFRDILAPLSRDFCYLDALSFMEVEDTLERAHNVLDDLWRHEPPYPKDRIKHLMQIIGQDICKYISKQIEKHNFWDDEFNKVTEVVYQLINIGEKWLTTCKQLTEIFWPNYSDHMWKDDIYVPIELYNYVQILHEAINIKTLHKQLIRLLTPEEQEEMKTKEMFNPLKETNIFNYGEVLPNTLIIAKKQFELLLEPAEKCVAMKLKKQLSTLNANTRQLLYEFSRYAEIITRPILKQALLSERQFLLSSLYEYIKLLQSKINSENNNFSNDIELSTTLKDVVLVKQIETRVKEVKNMAEKILNDLDGYDSINQQVNEILVDLKQQHNELFQSWVNEILSLISNDTLSLKETDSVVQFSKQKFMKVNYSNRFVMLISEVRQLRSMGFHIPNQIKQKSDHAKKFIRHARILDQIANFHNTIGDRMIPSLKPLMLTSALELSKLVQEQEVVSWGDEQSVEKYVLCLKNAVEKLSKENNMLSIYHNQVLEKINELEDVDLIKDYSKWKENVRVIRNIVTQVEDKGFKNMQLWKNDLDKQISKSLEKQYIKSLNTVHLYLPEIYTNLVYKNDEINFSPKEDELRKIYDQQLKKFLELPKQFRGISETSDISIYTDIIYVKNKEALDGVSKHTDELFGQLQSVMIHWKSWIQLEDLDINKLTKSQHWDLHFRSSKIFGQEVAKLPNTEEKLGCIIVGLSRLRLDLELHNRNYWDQLVYSLKDSIAHDVVKLQNFVDPATSALTRQSVTVEELADIGVSHGQILKDLPEMQEVFDEMLKKSVTLSSWSREQVDSVNRLKGAWERLLSLIESHHTIIEKQMDNIKMSLNVQIENLNKELELFSAKWDLESSNIYSNKNNATLEMLLEKIKSKKIEWLEISSKKDKIISDFNKFNIDAPEMLLFDKLESNLNKDIDCGNIFEEFYQAFGSLSNEYWIVFRKKIYLLEDFLNIWENKLKGEDNNELHKLLLKEIQKYKDIYPLLKYVRGDDFSNEHWMDIFALLQMTPKPIDQLLLNDWLNVSENIKVNFKQLEAISKKAASEIVIRQALNELDQWDTQAKFLLIEHKDSKNKDIMLIKEFKELLNKIGHNQSLLQSVKNSTDNRSFSDKTVLWENKLTDLEFYVTSLAQVQRKWLYLEPIFSSGTLANEKQRFDRIDRDVRNILNFIQKDSHLNALCRFSNLRSLLDTITDQLARCQNSLNNFLSEKRNKFPRFYFLSDEDLLEVVGQSTKEHVIQSHLKKLFSGINSIEFMNNKITALCSVEGEIVKLSNPINIQQPVEEWLHLVVKEMQITLKELLVQCQNERDAPDPLTYPSQILCLSDNITFTLKCEQAISSLTLPALLNKYKAQLKHYSSLEIHESDKLIASLSEFGDNDKSLLEIKLKALLLDTIHHINVLENLIDNNTSRATDWAWQKQLRFYSNSLGDVTVKMANSRMEYSYEYLGNAPKLVRTPLTDRCFLTLTQGLHLGMGGNPYGPAGTGKTESVKALGQLLGRQVLVFNCDEGIDALSMGRIISGLVRSGAWGCFDEFNRLEEATLSAVSMLIQPVQVALRNNSSKLNLLNQEVDLNKHCGIFVTLNPAGSNYGGRNKLPDNLKQLFRPVVMTHPDHEEIAKSLLHCDGYQNPSVLAAKIIEIFDLSSCFDLYWVSSVSGNLGYSLSLYVRLVSQAKPSQAKPSQAKPSQAKRDVRTSGDPHRQTTRPLPDTDETQYRSKQQLLSIGTILVGCSRSIKSRKLKSKSSESLSLHEEFILVVEVLRMNTLSKLTFSDSVKFDAIIKDVFKGVPINLEYGNSMLIKALEEGFHQIKLIPNQRQINKCLEFYEQLKQRMGVAIIGPPSCGKTTIRKLLFTALTKVNKVINTYAFNPKSMKRSQLLGYIDSDTKQWNDGVLTSYSLKVAAEPQEIWSWIVCDGDIDPDWVESLNSVLDDNRILTFPSGWRIQFRKNVNFIFESHNLTHASPATISRMGVVFLSEEDLQSELITKKFVEELVEETKPILEPLIQDSFIKAVNWIVNDGEVTIPSSKLSLTKAGLSFIRNVKNKTEFAVALANGLGQHLQYDFIEIFVNEVFNWLGEPEPPLPLSCRYNADRDIIDTYMSNPNIIIDNVSKGLPLILTGQILKTLDCLRIWMEADYKKPFLMVGPHGSAKRLILEHLVQEQSNVELLTIHCSSNLTPAYVISKLSQVNDNTIFILLLNKI